MVNAEYRAETTRLLITESKMWDEFTTKSLKKEEEEIYKQISEMIDKQLEAYYEYLDSEEAKLLFEGRVDYRKRIFKAVDEITLDNIWDAEQSVEKFIEDIYKESKEKGYQGVEKLIEFTPQDKTAIRLLKEYNFYLIKDVSGSVVYNIKNAIFQGVVAGSSIYEVADRIRMAGLETLPGMTLSPLQRATMIARTETARIKHTSTLQAYANVGLERCKILTAEDSHVCYICLRNAYEFNEDQKITYENRGDERIHSLDSVQPCIPAHPNCRCAVIPYLEEGEILAPVAKPKQINLIDDARKPLMRDENGKLIPILGNNNPDRKAFLEKYDIMNYNKTHNDKIPQNVIDFLKLYTGPCDKYLNGYLRNRMSYEEAKKEWNNELEFEEYNVDFDEALKLKDIVWKYAIPLEKDVMLCRREENRYFNEEEDDYGNKTYSDSALMSTSIGEYTKREDYGEELNYIKITEGTPILYLEGITLTPKDFEVLWPADTKLDFIEDLGKHKKVWKLSEK